MYPSRSGHNWLQLYADNRHFLERFFRQRITSAEDCEDLQQELFLKIHNLDPGAEISDPRAYLFRMASNLVNDLLRKRQSAAAVSEPAGDIADTPHDTYSAETSVMDREKIRILEEAIETLPPKCKEVFLLRKVEDLPNREIAERLGISQNMVEKHLRKALQDCRRYLEKKLQ